eukprot:TRINITY_DN2082_c0_g4_i1.p1 TRINITY_DN2082_c0_g4~~TRINITY_DN2082_c0_g4_i1.p1  ORF type:complete len:902 (+),score=265.55 TRINITY_DN2082_c0_g4_i1:101-2707(+)
MRAALAVVIAQVAAADLLHLHQPHGKRATGPAEHGSTTPTPPRLHSSSTPAPPPLIPDDLGVCAKPGCCNITVAGTTLRVCANQTCVSLPDVQLPGINNTVCLTPAAADCANNQTLAMVDASGVKFGGTLGIMQRIVSELLSFVKGRPAFSVYDFLAYPYTQGDPPNLGDFERCKGAPGDTKFCLYFQGFPRAGACMPPQCPPAAQKDVFWTQNHVYFMVADALGYIPSAKPLAGALRQIATLQGGMIQGLQISCSGIQRRVSGKDSHSETSSTSGKGFSGDSGAIAMTVIIVVLFCVNVISTFALWLRKVIRERKAEAERRRLLAIQESDGASGSETPGVTDTEATASPMHARLPQVTERERPPRGVWALLKCFDLVESRRQFLRISPRRPTSFLNGMRVISIAWVVLGHVLVYPMNPGFDNMAELERDYLPNFRMVFLASAFYAVDTFFFMSGFLACYSFTDENKGWKARLPDGGALKTVGATLMVYVDRYVRLTPAYLFLIFFAAYLLQYFGTGPLWSMAMDGGDVAQACSTYWYSNILYINNFPKYTDHGLDKMCFGHSWYLANDMQFLIVGTPIMILYTHREAAAWLCTILLMLTSWALIIATENGPDQAPDGSHHGYMRPYIRVAPYLYGLIACYVIRSHGDAILRHVSNAATRWAVYFVAFCLMFGGMVWQWQSWTSCGGFLECEAPLPKPDWANRWSEDMTRAFSWYYHFCWGLGLGMLTVVWTVGAKQKLGGWVVDFLSYPAFEPLYRLTYGVYLIHPMVLLCMKMTDVRQNHYTDYWLMTYWLAAVVGAYLASVLLHFFVERPSSLLWDLASGRSRRRSRKKRVTELESQADAHVLPAEQRVRGHSAKVVNDAPEAAE